jgi:cyanamide hydratase
MSFEFYGGLLALDVLKEKGGAVEQAESVVEAIIRHQDTAEVGTITTIGLLIQIVTQFGTSSFSSFLGERHIYTSAVTG